jgi:(S)-mandelate dehydrogenase
MPTPVERCLSIHDLQQHAQRYLPRVIYDYLEGGADDEQCLGENVARIRAVKLRPRYLVDIGARSQQVAVFGQTFASPFGIGPMGMLGMVRNDADLVLARVARRNGLPFVLSGACNVTTEALAAAAPGSWLQYYPCKSTQMEADLLERAAAAGIGTLVVTVDVPLHSKRERNMRSGWVRPYKPTPAVMLEALKHPAWVARYLRHGLPVMRNIQPYAPPDTGARELTAFYASQVPARHQWPLVTRLRAQWKGNLVLKGILSPEDAELAARHGVDGLIVSNHGGRQLDRSIAAIDALPEVVAAAGKQLVVMFDSGIRRGSDIAVALGLGARLCFIGRAAGYGVAAFGEAGAQRAVDILRAELDLTLGQIGCPDAADLGPRFLHRVHRASAETCGATNP